MAELKVLGAQRIKALTEVLDAQSKKAISEAKIATLNEIEKMVDEEYGLTAQRNRLEALEVEIESLKAKIDAITGEFSYRYGKNDLPYIKRKGELRRQLIDEPVDAIKREYDEKARSLWLCETLEEAKKIVYGEA